MSIYNKLLITLLLFSFWGCSNNKKSVTTTEDTISIHKLWKYDTVRTVPSKAKPMWIGKNLLDLTGKDTLRFSYQSIKQNATAYAYNITHDTVFVNHNAAYKILKLTADELDLYTIFKNSTANTDSIVMIYKVK